MGEAPIKWFRDGLEVKEGPNLKLEVNGTQRQLIIPIATVDDTGEYVCDTKDDSVAFLVTVTGKNAQKFASLMAQLLFFILAYLHFEL